MTNVSTPVTTTVTHSAIELTADPYAELFPILSPESFNALVADIQANGQHESIIVNARNQIIDGMNRYRACVRLNKTPKYVKRDISDEKALSLMITRNVVRRHMSETQRAAVAAELRKSANLPITQVALATVFNISEPMLRSAEHVLEARPDLHEKLKTNDLTVHAAEEIIDLPPDERIEALEEVKRGDIRRAKARVKAAKRHRGYEPISQQAWTDKRSKGWHASYAQLFSAIQELPQLLVDHPLSNAAVEEVIKQLRQAIVLIESAGKQD